MTTHIATGLIGVSVAIGVAAWAQLAKDIHNDVDKEKKREKISKLIDNADQEIVISTDLECLHDGAELVEKLQSAVERGVDITVRFDPRRTQEYNSEKYSQLRSLAENESVVVEPAPNELNRHYMIFDQTDIRMDQHPIGQFGNEGKPGVIIKDHPTKAAAKARELRTV
jgi:sugar-specific transcriptional regulator TrmB